jgi:RNA-directed DNA polymerase
MHDPVPAVGEWLGRVLTGFYQYHAVPGNWASLYRFRERLGRYWHHALTRRSQTGRLSAERVTRLLKRWLPRPRLVHRYPSERFDARYPR